MGQRIDVTPTAIGDTAIFDLDRSLTGQDQVSFSAPPDETSSPPSLLAYRLFSADPNINHVHTLSNAVSVTREGGWPEDVLTAAVEEIADLFIHYRAENPEEVAQRLRDEHYNATITDIQAPNPELWIMKVLSDEQLSEFKPGQYTTLALGYWEPRVDDAMEDFDSDPDLRHKLARRSYSVSSSMVDGTGELLGRETDELEFYIVLVDPTEEHIPALTPRIFKKKAGDRIFLGRKFTGRYTLDHVKQGDTCIFLATGTGEAPHNQMIAELLRRGHDGRILSAVCVRYRQDLGYTEQHAVLEDRYANYSYVVLTTREPENEGNKVYIQDLVTSGQLEQELGQPLDPSTTHVFLCGNPSMIGIPERDDETGELTFPEILGVCQILHERGFKIDYRRDPGNVHYEEYW